MVQQASNHLIYNWRTQKKKKTDMFGNAPMVQHASNHIIYNWRTQKKKKTDGS